MTKNPKVKLSFFPRPIIHEKNYDWSFSGLKTAVLNEVKDKTLNEEEKQKIAAEVQEAIVDVLVKKTLRAVREYKPKSLLLAGGVAANTRLTEKFKIAINEHAPNTSFFVPQPKFCTDNAAYIASFAYFNHSPIAWQKINANPQLTIAGQI